MKCYVDKKKPWLELPSLYIYVYILTLWVILLNKNQIYKQHKSKIRKISCLNKYVEIIFSVFDYKVSLI